MAVDFFIIYTTMALPEDLSPEELKKIIGVYRPPQLKHLSPESESSKSDRLLRQVMGMSSLPGPRSQAEIDNEHKKIRSQIGEVSAGKPPDEPPKEPEKKTYKL